MRKSRGLNCRWGERCDVVGWVVDPAEVVDLVMLHQWKSLRTQVADEDITGKKHEN